MKFELLSWYLIILSSKMLLIYSKESAVYTYNYHICAKVQVWHSLTAASDAKFESVKVHEGLILRTTAYC